MRWTSWRLVVGAIPLALVAASSADAAVTAADAARSAASAATLAAVDVAEEDRAGAAARLDAASAAVTAAATGTARERRILGGVARRLDAASARTADLGRSDERAVRAIRLAARAGHAAARSLRTPADGMDVREFRGGDGFHRPFARVDFVVADCDEAPVVTVTSASPSPVRTFTGGVQMLGARRFRVTLGPDLGGALVSVTACGVTREWLLFDQGPPRALRFSRPQTPDYQPAYFSLRAGIAATPHTPSGRTSDVLYEIGPPPPDGLQFDAATGTISGTPSAPAAAAAYAVVARNRRGAAAGGFGLQITPALPSGVAALEDGFAISPVALGLNAPVKMAFAPDGRLFFNELTTGNVRVVGANGTLVATPFATVPVLASGEAGLLGVAVAPDFATSGHVFVYACTPHDAVLPDRAQVLRFTDTAGVGTAMTTIVPSLPVAGAQNGGDIRFGPDGKLYVSVGDTADPALAQTDGSRAGRILRFNPDGSIPADSPIADDPEWCRGLRNPFDITFHPATGGLFASENGPTAHDELDFIQRAKNYEWGAEPETVPGALTGFRMIDWTPVIVPTGITFLARGAFGEPYAENLFVAGYDQADVRRIVLSGAQFTDVEDELPFARFDNTEIDNKPLDLAEAPDGSLYVSTFTAIWRISRY